MQYLTPRSAAVYRPSSSVILRLTPRRILAWVYIARFSISTGIFLAAVLMWQSANPTDTLLASLAFAAVMCFTVASALYTEVYRRPVTPPFLYGQFTFDLLLVTVITHVTWDISSSQFAPLYILVIAIAALALPVRGVSLVSVLAIGLYITEVIWIEHVFLNLAVVLQLVVFGIVALGSGYIAARLHEAGLGSEALAEELARFRLRQGDVERLHLRAERLEAVAELSASMAHEIKNPLASIRSAVEQLATSPRTTEQERTLTALVQRESDRLSRLLTSFLDFARVDMPRSRPIDLVEVVQHAAELADTYPDRPDGVRVELDLPRAPLMIEGDEDMLHRALFNLILNAIQASPADGMVRVEGATLLPQQLTSQAPAFDRGAIALRVIDQGPGIPDDVRPKLFHPFFTTKQGGNGLGLAIVHRVIEAHRGAVIVNCDARGTSFTVLLPRS